ncbi:MAG: DMT family transporter [Anaerolineae bacterium]|jgi:drug/metabolite transporter (DMT)-like permease
MMIPETKPGRRLEQLTGIGLVNLATFTWATNMVLGRWLRDDIGPLTLAAARFLIASVLFAALLQRRPPEERHLGQSRWLLLGMALSGVAVFAPTLYLGLRFTTAVNATLMNGLGPLITGFLAALLIREPMSGRQVTGAIVGLIGVVSLISGGSFIFPLGGSATSWEAVGSSGGDLIVLAAVALWGLYSVLGRQVMRDRSALSATAFSAFLGLPLLLLAATWEVQAFPVALRPALILAVLYIGVAPTVIGFLAWNAGVRRLGASGAMMFYNTLPLYGALLGSLFLGESIGPAHLLGGVLIIGGGIFAALGRSQERSRS